MWQQMQIRGFCLAFPDNSAVGGSLTVGEPYAKGAAASVNTGNAASGNRWMVAQYAAPTR